MTSSGKLNDSLPSHPSNSAELEIAIQEYIGNNKSPDTSPITIWEAHKYVLRGYCIRQASYIKKEKQKLQRELEKSLINAIAFFNLTLLQPQSHN